MIVGGEIKGSVSNSPAGNSQSLSGFFNGKMGVDRDK